MKIYNKTNQIQELRIYDRSSEKFFSIFIVARGSTELDKYMVIPPLDPEVFGLEEVAELQKDFPLVDKSTEVERSGLEEEEESDVVSPEVVEAQVFVCEECGTEYATQKALSRHINKVHKSDEVQ